MSTNKSSLHSQLSNTFHKQDSSQSGPRIFINAFRAYIMPQIQLVPSTITISVKRHTEICQINNDVVDQELQPCIEVLPNNYLSIKYRTMGEKQENNIAISYTVLSNYLKYGGTEFSVMNDIGTFIVNMIPCETKFLIKPDLLIEFTGGTSDNDTTNRDIIAELQEAGIRASQRRTILERLQWGADILDGLSTVIGAVSEVHPAVGIVSSCLTALIKTVQTDADMKSGILDLIDDMSEVIAYTFDVRNYSNYFRLHGVIKDLGELAKEVKTFVDRYNSSSQARAFINLLFTSGNDQDKIQELKDRLSRFKERFDRSTNIQCLMAINQVFEELRKLRGEIQTSRQATNEEENVLRRLNPRQSTRSLRCYKDNRKDVRDAIDKWAHDFGAYNVLRISGYPGVGKSTVAFQTSVDLREKDHLGFIIDFDRTSQSDTNPKVVWSSMAYEIAIAYEECKKEIISILNGRTFRLEDATAGEVFQRLVVEPLIKTKSTFPRDRFPVFIIDALDECGSLDGSTSNDRKGLLEHIRQWSQLLPSEFKLIVTGRDESDIQKAFETIPHVPLPMLTGLDVTEESTSDIQLYIHDEFEDIAKSYWLTTGWPGSEVEEELARRAGGIFIWAVTAVAYIKERDPVHRLRVILEETLPEGGVYVLYSQILNASFPDNKRSQLFVKLASVIIATQRYLTAQDWAHLLNTNKAVIERIHDLLRTVVIDGDVIRFRHQSFIDFLLGNIHDQTTGSSESTAHARCPKRFSVDIEDGHRTLTKACFFLMNSELRFNICNVKSSYFPNDNQPLQQSINAVPPPLAYACEFWHIHMQQLSSVSLSKEDVNLVLRFVQERSLFWIETLSVLGIMGVAVDALHTVLGFLKRSTTDEITNSISTKISRRFRRTERHEVNSKESLYEFVGAPLVDDSIKFTRFFAQAIAINTTHVYLSGIPFLPQRSCLRHIYESKFRNGISVEIGRLHDWPADQIVIRRSSGFTSAVISHNSNYIVSGSVDGTVQVWDTRTGESIVGPLKGHTRRVNSVALSHDSRRIVSCSGDKTIRIWDVETGDLVGEPLTGHTEAVLCVLFSHDSKYIASGSIDNTIRVWKVGCSEAANNPLVLAGHSDYVRSVVFSNDDMRVISGSNDNTIRVWNAHTGALEVDPLTGHSGVVFSVSMSHDGKLVASASGDETIRIWDTTSWKTMGKPFRGHTSYVLSVSFSHDDTRIVSGSLDNTILIWDVRSGTIVAGPFTGHAESVNSVAFSHDDKRIVSSSDDGTIRIWDAEWRGSVEERYEVHTKGIIYCVALSRDGTRIASGSDDCTVRIWCTVTGKMVGRVLEGHGDRVSCVAFSPDGERVVSGSSDSTIRVWSTKTSKCLFTIESHEGSVFSVAFSHDGRRIVSGSLDKTIRIWNADTGDLTLPPIKVDDWVYSVTFSHDDTRVASGSNVGIIQIWNSETGEMIGNPIIGHQYSVEGVVTCSYVKSVAFSHDSKLVVSASGDRTVRVWNVETGQMVAGPFEHEGVVQSVVFSADSKLVISGSRDQTIRVWDVQTGQTVIGPLKGHEGPVQSVAISSDDNRLVSGSDDGTIRVWDLTQFHHPFTHEDQFPGADGWVKGEHGELLFWAPHIYRHSLYRPRNVLVIGQRATRVNFSRDRLGDKWTECYTPTRTS